MPAESGAAIELTGRLADTGRTVRVRIEDGLVSDLSVVDDETDVWLAPGLFDIQLNGYGGADVNADDVDADVIRDLVRGQWRLGVTTMCPTIVTGSEERILRALRAVAQARDADPLVRHALPCVHVEGPHISSEDGPRGAHDARHVRPPDVVEFRRWQQAGGGVVGIVTVAPELPGAIDYIAELSGAGVIAAIGHTAAEPHDIEAAVTAGARLSTHLGNGAHGSLPRHPNYIWEQLADDRLTASFIADGHHLPRSVLRVMVRAKGIARSILISDATALAGMPPGRYDTPVGGLVELSADGRLSLADSSLLAGAARSLPECVAWAAGQGGIGLRDAVRMATANPAALVTPTAHPPRGELRIGAAADVVAFRVDTVAGRFDVDTTVVGGVVVHGEGPATGREAR